MLKKIIKIHTYLDEFLHKKIYFSKNVKKISCHFQPRLLLSVPCEGGDGRQRDEQVHHRGHPAQALRPVRPGGGQVPMAPEQMLKKGPSVMRIFRGRSLADLLQR